MTDLTESMKLVLKHYGNPGRYDSPFGFQGPVKGATGPTAATVRGLVERGLIVKIRNVSATHLGYRFWLLTDTGAEAFTRLTGEPPAPDSVL
jgi:hypothetical protein